MKFFSDKWDFWHFYGQILVGIIVVLMFKHPVIAVQISFAVVVGTLATSFYWWELWDIYKKRYNSPDVAKWSWLTKAIFTSEGRFSKKDMIESFLGFILGLIIMSLIG